MSLQFRRFLYLTFIAAFIIVTPLLILYANGYSFNTGSKGFVKTGMFIFDTQPGGAKVTINGKFQTTFFNSLYPGNTNFITTPAKIKNLMPGEYDVAIELPGYWPWRKKLTIYPGTSTYAENIILFKKELPMPIVNIQFDSIAYNSKKTYAAVLNKNNFQVINLATGDSQSVASNTSAVTPE